MVTIVGIEKAGDRLLERYSDGSTRFFFPIANGRFLPGALGSVQEDGSGGEVTEPGTNPTVGTVTAPVDDYPWPDADPNGTSPLRYSYRDCTDFVAWRANRDIGVTSAPWAYTWGNLRWQGDGGNGDAIGWRGDWIKYGRGVDLAPAPGLIGWYGTKAGTYGHVNYVQAVQSDGTVHLEEYNWSPNHQAYNQRDASPGDPYYPDSFLAMPARP